MRCSRRSAGRCQAVVQAAEEAAEQVALGPGVPVAVFPGPVVVGSGAGDAVRAAKAHLTQTFRIEVLGFFVRGGALFVDHFGRMAVAAEASGAGTHRGGPAVSVGS